MDAQSRRNLAGGIIMVLVGALLLVFQLVPELGMTLRISYSWPLIVIGLGALFFIFGLLFNAPGMAVPACIIGGIGGLLYWQNITGRWETWAYTWALIPGFAGVGAFLAGLLEGKFRSALRDGGTLVVISLILFAIFASFLGGFNFLGAYWPALIILFGVWLLIRPLLR